MKKFVFFCLSVILTTTVFAQQQLATLLHNDSIRVFYGTGALQSAHAAAVNGDVITLSGGSFNSVNITKAVTIRGAGMYPDTIAQTSPTILIGDFTITVPQDSNYWLTLEGLYHSQTVKYQTLYNPVFIKCFFNRITYNNSSTERMNNARVINCIIKEWGNKTEGNVWVAVNTQFYNSVILNGLDNGCNDQLINCVAKIDNYPSTNNGNIHYLDNKTIINSIVYDNSYDGYNNGVTSFNSIGINTYTSYGSTFSYYDISSAGGVHNLHNYTSYAQVFKTFRGTYSDGIDFHLQDNIATTILGTDSTQVGIYGGQCPFDPSVRNPLIGKANVGRTTTAQGKLEVDIEVISEAE